MNRTATPSIPRPRTSSFPPVVGQRVTVFGHTATAWIDHRNGTVIAVTGHDAELVFVRMDGAGVEGVISPVRQVAARRIAPVSTCETCRMGCDCEYGVPGGCDHYGCWGLDGHPDCPGAAVEAARMAALEFARGWTR